MSLLLLYHCNTAEKATEYIIEEYRIAWVAKNIYFVLKNEIYWNAEVSSGNGEKKIDEICAIIFQQRRDSLQAKVAYKR